MTITIDPKRVEKLNAVALKHGKHDAPPKRSKGLPDMCVLEAAAWVAGEPWSGVA